MSGEGLVMNGTVSDYPPRDDCGMTSEDWRWLLWELERERILARWKAIKALWGKPKLAKYPCQFVTFERARGDEWSFWRAVRATIGLAFDLEWTDDMARKARQRGRCSTGMDLAYWDNRSVYGGYSVWVVWLYPGFRISMFNDGETFL